jgi:hypothetical protein
MSSHICKTFLSKLLEIDKKKEGKFIRVRTKGRQVTHETKMTNATYAFPKKEIIDMCHILK